MKWPLPVTFAICAVAVSACGGGGGAGGGQGAVPPARNAAPPGATSKPSPTSSPTTAPTGSSSTPYPPDPTSKIRSTYGRIGLAQIFDYFPNDDNSMPASEISADASRYDLVWGSFDPGPWRSSNAQALVSRYYIIEEDNELISGHNLSWWQQNHPDWILYACDSSGTPTHDIAFTPDDGFPDVPLNIHNPSVVAYQLQSLTSYVRSNGYNALALDQVDFSDIMEGGNPYFGQTVKSGEFGCGVWNADGSFTKVYSGTSDPTWTQDVLNWVATARQSANAAGLAVIVNHPGSGNGNANDQALIENVDATVVESGFSDYGLYQTEGSGLFLGAYQYMEWVQKQGVAIVVIDRFPNNQTVTSDQLEYSIATYLMGNEGSADLFVGGENASGYGYGVENYHQEYATQLGKPCDAMYGGASYSASSPQVYYRRFQNGLSVVNAGTQTEKATLPNDHVYTDLESRPVTNPLSVPASDAYVLVTTGGNGCQ
jgi:hypothetical protein